MATKIGSLFGDVSLRTAQLDKDIASVGKKLNKLGGGMKSLGKDMTAKLTAPLIGVGVAALVSFGKFEKGMNEVRSLMPDLNQGEFVQLQEDVRALAVEMGVNAVDSVQALYQAISAGVPKGSAIEFLRVSNKAAIAGVTDVETSVNALTGVLNAYKRSAEEAEEVADVLFTTVRLGKTTFGEIGSSISDVAPIAASLNVPIEEVSAALASITKQNTPTAQAMTQIRGALVALIKPNADMAAALRGMGYESGQALLDAKGLQGALEALRTESGLTTGELVKAFGRVEAFGAVTALTGQNFQGAIEDLKAMTQASGAMTQAFETNNEGLFRSWEKSLAIIREVGFQIAEQLAPYVMEVALAFKEWYAANEASIPGWVQLGVKIGATAAVLGPVLIVLGSLVTVLASSVTWIVGLGVGLGVLIHKLRIVKEVGAAFGQMLVDIWNMDYAAFIGSLLGYLGEIIEMFTGIQFSAEKMRADVINVFNAIGKVIDRTLGKLKSLWDMFSRFSGAKGAGEFLGGVISDIAFRADGGPVSSGSPYIVGEQGPELFVPRYSGAIVPNNALGGGGGQTINMTFNGVGMEMKSWLKNNRSALARIAVDAVSENNLRTV